MPLQIPSRKTVVEQAGNYLRAELPELDPSTERRSFIGGLRKAFGSLVADFYLALKRYADREPFPQTATGTFLTQGWWRDITKLDPTPAAPAHGYVAVTGSDGATVPVGTEFQSSGTTFSSMLSKTVMTQSLVGVPLTYSPGTGKCIFKTASDHFLATGMTVVISGATPSAYNGTFQITVTDSNEFTYTPASVPASSPATGSPLLTATYTAVEVEATTTGQSTNEDAGTSLSLSSAPIGVDSTAVVCFGGLSGGTDEETHDAYRERILQALGTDFGMFTADEIKVVAKQVPGVTRVFVRTASVSPPSGWPLEGQVKISFLRDNDASPIPSATEVADVKAAVLAIKPSHVAEEDVIVVASTEYTVNFAFSSISPDTAGMRLAITEKLRQFLLEQADWGGTIPEIDYKCAIREAYDVETRQALKTFVLTSPSGDISPGVDGYPVLGTVSF